MQRSVVLSYIMKDNRLAIVILSIHSALIAMLASWNSVTFDETGHIAAGLVHWKFSDFSLFAVNPPLVRLMAMLPAMPIVGDHEIGPYSAVSANGNHW